MRLHAPPAEPQAAAPDVFDLLRSLFLPVDGDPGRTVWGRPPQGGGTSLPDAMATAFRRERDIRRIRAEARRSDATVTVHRLAPPALRTDRPLRQRLRQVLLGGVLVEQAETNASPRALDLAAIDAGGLGATVEGVMLGAGGTLLCGVRTAAGTPLVVRMGLAGTSAEPSRSADALDHLAGSRCVPRLAGRGVAGRVAWVAESPLPGSRPARLTVSLLDQSANFLATLPRADGPPTSPAEALAAMASALPGFHERLASLAIRLTAALRDVPAVAGHGDLWLGNLLARGGRLTGVVDWDAWHPAAVPGADLLHLLARDRALRQGRELGDLVAERPWTDPEFELASVGYWRTFGIEPNGRLLLSVGAAWWAGQVAATLTRYPLNATDERWVERNIASPLGAFERWFSPASPEPGARGRARILMVGKGPPDNGGISSFMQGLLKGPMAERHDVRLLNLTRREVPHGGRFTFANLTRTFQDTFAVWGEAKNADVVHIHSALAPMVTLLRAGLFAAAARMRGARTVVHAHGGMVQLWLTTPARRRLAKLALTAVDRVVAVSDDGRAALAATFGDAKVVLVDNGVDLEAFAGAEPGTHTPPRILFAGVLSPRKGLVDLLRASELLLDRGVDHELWLAGGTPAEGPDAERSVRNEPSRGARFLGERPHDAMPDLFRRADVYCLPSWYEAMPMSILEAMASGLPVVATTVGEVPRLVEDGVTGTLVLPKDPAALADALEPLLRGAGVRVRMGRAGRDRVAGRFDARTTSRRLLRIYDEVRSGRLSLSADEETTFGG